uniref:C-type lectin domain-containing protein n=1 Tax=Spermophilus dauricus TaxID=99837 RepID=A0A8C9ULD4_SPEDA
WVTIAFIRNSRPVLALGPWNVSQGASWHQLAWKFGCAGIILLILSVIGLSVLVISLIQKSPMEKSSVDIQEKRNYTTETPRQLQCPKRWLQLQDKCFTISSSSKTWNDSLADCSQGESSLLLIQDQEELRFIQNLIKNEGIMYWIGLNFTLSEKKWKWINGSLLNHDILKVEEIREGSGSCLATSVTAVSRSATATTMLWVCAPLATSSNCSSCH